ncbi:MAG: glutaminyl-peptide cyclotransferase [Pseudomonadota bacterium]
MFNLKKQMLQPALFLVLISFGICAQAKNDAAPKPAPLLGFKVIKTLPHDSAHYTQGLVFYKGKLLESAGEYGESGLYEKDLKTGKTLRSRAIEPQFFAEGLAVAHDRIVQLTWRENTAFVYDLAFNPLGTLNYNTEGWGLASFNQDKELVMSDGSPILRFIDASDYHFLRQITVRDGDQEIMRLNELEEANGLIYANVWLTDKIAVIDPADGRVVNWLDLSRLQTSFKKPAKWNELDNVLNGIAYDSRTGHFYVTGKRWPVLFEIKIDPPQRRH